MLYDDTDEPFDIPEGDDTIDPDQLPDDFDTDELPSGWEYWTWDDLWAWIDENYDIPDFGGDSPSGAFNG